MMTVADTRYQNPIWIDWYFDTKGEAQPIFQEFSNIEEHYDAWAVYAVLCVESSRKKDESQFNRFYNDAEENYGEIFKIDIVREQVEAPMKISGVAQRAIYGRSLLRVKFQKK